MTSAQIHAAFRTVPRETAVTILAELNQGRFLEAMRLAGVALGDVQRGTELIASINRDRVQGRGTV